MKIAIVTDHVPSRWAHIINIMKHANAFHNLGHYVEILIIRRMSEDIQNLSTKDVFRFYDINENLSKKYFRDYSLYYFKGLKLRFIGAALNMIMDHIEIKYPRIYSIFDIERKIYKYCQRKNFDFVYFRATGRIVKFPLYCILNKINIIIESHYNIQIDTDLGFLKRVFKLGNNKYFKGLITIHEILKNQYIKYGVPKEKILVIEGAVDLLSFLKVNESHLNLRQILGFPLNKNIIIYCGSLQRGKAIGDILKTAKKLDVKDTLFYIIGGSKKENKDWKKKAKKMKIMNVFFLGFKENSLIPIYLKCADILFFPYNFSEKKTVMDIHTTSPTKLFQYMAAKKPIISSKIPTIEKVIKSGEDALLASPGNINEIIKYISMLLKDKSLAESLAENAFKKVKNFTYINRCKKIINKFCS